MTSAFLVTKGLSCLYDKKNNTTCTCSSVYYTWRIIHGFLQIRNFSLSCSTRHLTRSLRSLVSYQVKYSKRNSISTRALVLFSMYNKLKNTSGLIGPYLWSIRGQTHRGRHHEHPFALLQYYTNRFHVAVSMDSNRSQKMSQCDKNSSDTLGCTSWSTFLFLTRFNSTGDLLLNRGK